MGRPRRPIPDSYKWIALSNTTLGVAIATINASILLISLPDIFEGIDIGHHTMGWTSPKVIGEIAGGVLMLIAFCFIETRVEQPMFHLDLFKIRAFSAATSRR